MNTQKLEDACWHFFESVLDTTSMSTAKICADLVNDYDFNIEVLPPNLYKNTMKILGDIKKENLYWSIAQDLSMRCANDYND